jgi:hypothetical protein
MGQNLGVQIKLWLPESIYSVVRELAAATDGNVSEAVRILLKRGIGKDALDIAAQEVIDRVTSQLDHLERLVYFAALESARTADGIDDATIDSGAKRETVAKMLETRKLRAITRLRQALHGRNPVLSATEETDEEAADDE